MTLLSTNHEIAEFIAIIFNLITCAPYQIYCIYEFTKLKNLEIIKKRHYKAYLFILFYLFIYSFTTTIISTLRLFISNYPYFSQCVCPHFSLFFSFFLRFVYGCGFFCSRGICLLMSCNVCYGKTVPCEKNTPKKNTNTKKKTHKHKTHTIGQ